MKIELIKLKFNDTYSYKYKPFQYCCDEIQNDKAIVFTGEDLVCNDIFGLVVRDSDYTIIPQFCNSYTEIFNSCGDEYEQTDNYPIQFVLTVAKRLRFQLQMRLMYLISTMNYLSSVKNCGRNVREQTVRRKKPN